MQKYFISTILFVLTLFSTSFAQEQELPKRQFFIRGGLDLSRFALPYLGDIAVKGWEASLDSEIKMDFFPTVEFGMNSIDHKTEAFNYESSGSYFRVGLNYNMLNYQHRLDRNIFFIGARYAFSNYHQQADNIVLDSDWGTYETSFPNKQLNQHWAEAIIGLRGEIFKNFYMGYSIRIKIRLSQSDYGDLTPYFVPGYGDPSKNLTAGMSYSIFYAIPIINIK